MVSCDSVSTGEHVTVFNLEILSHHPKGAAASAAAGAAGVRRARGRRAAGRSAGRRAVQQQGWVRSANADEKQPAGEITPSPPVILVSSCVTGADSVSPGRPCTHVHRSFVCHQTGLVLLVQE